MNQEADYYLRLVGESLMVTMSKYYKWDNHWSEREDGRIGGCPSIYLSIYLSWDWWVLLTIHHRVSKLQSVLKQNSQHRTRRRIGFNGLGKRIIFWNTLYLSLYLSIFVTRLFVWITYICMNKCMYVHICLSIHLSIYLSITLAIYVLINIISIYQLLNLSFHISTHFCLFQLKLS